MPQRTRLDESTTDKLEDACTPSPDADGAGHVPLALLLGVAVGDALGVPVEFQPRGSFLITDMEGYGTYHQPPGTWSDDTSLTLALADNLGDGPPDLAAVAQAFVDWYGKAAYTAHGSVFDIGRATAQAILRLNQGVPPAQAGGALERDNGNGSLMRIAPLVFVVADLPPAERFGLVKAVSSMTHAHEWAVAACCIQMEMLRQLCLGRDRDAAYAAVRAEPGLSCVGAATVHKFDRILKGDIRTLPEDAIRSSGFVIDTLEAAFWAFLTTDNYHDAVLRAVNLGEDTDTTGAVTGALAGVAYGVEGIPRQWREQLAAREEIARIARKIPWPVA